MLPPPPPRPIRYNRSQMAILRNLMAGRKYWHDNPYEECPVTSNGRQHRAFYQMLVWGFVKEDYTNGAISISDQGRSLALDLGIKV